MFYFKHLWHFHGCVRNCLETNWLDMGLLANISLFINSDVVGLQILGFSLPLPGLRVLGTWQHHYLYSIISFVEIVFIKFCNRMTCLILLIIGSKTWSFNNTLQKYEVLAQLFAPEKHFKICYVYEKRKLM